MNYLITMLIIVYTIGISAAWLVSEVLIRRTVARYVCRNSPHGSLSRLNGGLVEAR